jgi:hypothetical protein
VLRRGPASSLPYPVGWEKHPRRGSPPALNRRQSPFPALCQAPKALQRREAGPSKTGLCSDISYRTAIAFTWAAVRPCRRCRNLRWQLRGRAPRDATHGFSFDLHQRIGHGADHFLLLGFVEDPFDDLKIDQWHYALLWLARSEIVRRSAWARSAGTRTISFALPRSNVPIRAPKAANC